MKTLPAFAFIAAFVAFLVFPFDFQNGISLLFVAGFAAIALRDYAPPTRRLDAADIAARVRNERLRLAA